MSLLDDVFEILETATRYEKSGNRIEAATKFFEATYLMRKVLASTPQEEVETRRLLEEKIKHFSAAASRLYFDDTSVDPSRTEINEQRSPMSQLSQQAFFQEEVTHQPAHLPSSCESPRFTQSAELNKMASQANSTLSRAIDLDETGKVSDAIKTYMEAAELYLATIRLYESKSSSSSIAPVLKRRLEGALDRIEQLKLSKKGGNAQRSKSGLLQVSKKQAMDTTSVSTASSFTKEEIEVLKRSSLIASGVFLPWSEEEASLLSKRVQQMRICRKPPGSLFVDKDGELVLSAKQQKNFHKWARPSEIASIRKSFGIQQHAPTMIQSINPYSIRQQFVTDCSFIASLCICAAFEKRFRKRLITSIIYPQDENGIPMYNPEGKYMVKLWLNGVVRQVIVDDRLPIDQNSNLLCSHSTGNREKLELWVSIIEKAYMKLCGGYDFPGSNRYEFFRHLLQHEFPSHFFPCSGVDLFSLTGWIPERIFFPKDSNNLRDFETEPERAWDRLYSANSFGDCLITVSTTREITEAQAELLGLVTGHAYAVLEVFQARDGTRLLQLKNPWASKGWTGKYSPHDRASWTNHTLRAEVGYNPEVAAKHDDGIFWICWEDVLRYFQNIQLSWNPSLFAHRVVTHSIWPGNQGPANDTFNIGENPQYVMVLSDEALLKKVPVWVMLSRHVTKQEQEGADVDDFLTIHLLRNTEKKERMWYPHGRNSLVNGAYSNNPHVLVRYDVTHPEDKYISLVLSQHQKSHDLAYTLSCYCTEPFTLTQPQKDLPYILPLVGSWTMETAGGPMGKQDFFRNPMYAVTLSDDIVMQIRCSAEKSVAGNSKRRN